ncbi:MAG: AbiH family protein [Saccharofermentans sp.]|nr:AbiH family protein [Saccharofermentans sp.]
MKVLIIGNGFDVANGLPTKYSQFLDICKAVDSCGRISDKSRIRLCDLSDDDKNKLANFYTTVGQDIYNEFLDLSKHNLFIRHFLDRGKIIGDKWLNFEEEIQNFIERVLAEKNNAPNELFRTTHIKTLKDHINSTNFLGKTYRDLFEMIREQHKNLIRLLEIYMDGYVNRLPLNKIDGFKKDFYNHILSFNYTDTYSEKYEPELCSCCYIHGQAFIDKTKQCQMVLGFDNKQKYPVITDIEMLPYVKFFQRLDLKTPADYMEWLKVMALEDENLVDIYGHSLAFSDADIISDFIRTPRTKTRIYYYDELDRYDKLRNLTLILGTKDTVEMISGKRCIEFVPTTAYSTKL